KQTFYRKKICEQVRLVGCCYNTYRLTPSYIEARAKGWIELKTPKVKKIEARVRAITMTPAMEASIGTGVPDEVLHTLTHEETQKTERDEWFSFGHLEGDVVLDRLDLGLSCSYHLSRG